jgi:hypothetical protein
MGCAKRQVISMKDALWKTVRGRLPRGLETNLVKRFLVLTGFPPLYYNFFQGFTCFGKALEIRKARVIL